MQLNTVLTKPSANSQFFNVVEVKKNEKLVYLVMNIMGNSSIFYT